MIFYGILSFLALLLAYLIIITFFPVLKPYHSPENKALVEENEAPQCRTDVSFEVEGEKLSAWLYMPEDQSKQVSCVVLSTGFCGTKELVIESYAMAFVRAGFAALTYDYRHFGESDGMPRQLFSATKQMQDLRGAIDFAHKDERIDPGKIVLWGTSAGGNYGICAAAEDHRIAAVIAQCAALDHKEDSKLFLEYDGIKYILRLIPHAQRDKMRSRFGLSEHTIRAYGVKGTHAVIAVTEEYKGILHLTKDSQTFKNEVCARLILTKRGEDPIKSAPKVQCPVMIQICEKDHIVSPKSHVRVANALGNLATIIKYPISHFDIYQGEYFELAVKDQIEFIKKYV